MIFAVSSFFAVNFRQADGKDILSHQPIDGKELADGRDPDSSSDTMKLGTRYYPSHLELVFIV